MNEQSGVRTKWRNSEREVSPSCYFARILGMMYHVTSTVVWHARKSASFLRQSMSQEGSVPFVGDRLLPTGMSGETGCLAWCWTYKGSTTTLDKSEEESMPIGVKEVDSYREGGCHVCDAGHWSDRVQVLQISLIRDYHGVVYRLCKSCAADLRMQLGGFIKTRSHQKS